jgi:hypothetical protein
MSVFEHIFTAIPAHATAGKHRVIATTTLAGLKLKEAVSAASKRDDLTPKGRAALVATAMKDVGAAFQASRRQHAYHARKLETQEAAVKTKAIGEANSTDAEYRTYLRGLPESERTQKVLSDPNARSAALREPGLSGLNDEFLTKLMDVAIQQNAPTEAAALENAKEAQVSHGAAIKALANELMKTPFIVEPNGNVRNFLTPHELENFLTKEIPAPQIKQIAGEEAIADHVEAA